MKSSGSGMSVTAATEVTLISFHMMLNAVFVCKMSSYYM